MKLFASIEGDIRAMMKAELEAAERAVTTGVFEVATGLQTAWRGQITGAAHASERSCGFRHLHQREQAFLHARAAGRGKANQRRSFVERDEALK